MNLSFHCNDWELTFRDLQFITISQIIIYCGWNMILLLLCLSLLWGQIENFLPSFPTSLVLQPCFEKPSFFCIYCIWWNDTILNLQESMSVYESSTSSSREWKETSLMSTQGLQWKPNSPTVSTGPNRRRSYGAPFLGGGVGWGTCHVACGVLAPQPGIKPTPPCIGCSVGGTSTGLPRKSPIWSILITCLPWGRRPVSQFQVHVNTTAGSLCE